MKKADSDLIVLNRAAFAKALTAAAIRLREDRRIMAMPKIRDVLADLAALVAIGSDTNDISYTLTAGLFHDQPTYMAYQECRLATIEAAKKALEGVELRKPEPKQ